VRQPVPNQSIRSAYDRALRSQKTCGLWVSSQCCRRHVVWEEAVGSLLPSSSAAGAPGATGRHTPYRRVPPQPRTAVPTRDRGDENPAILIAGWEPDNSRWSVIEGVCTACGASPHRLAGTRHRATIVEPQRYAAAIVALQERPESPKSCLPIVTQLKDVGLCVIAHEFGVAAWPVATRCRVLLAGARYLFDSRSSDFHEVLAATLIPILRLSDLRLPNRGGRWT
jgi:hypothetical protein